MIKSAILAAISAAALASGGMAYAQTPAAKATSAVKTTATKRVTATTKTGKTVHYDCSKAGNANKKACK